MNSDDNSETENDDRVSTTADEEEESPSNALPSPPQPLWSEEFNCYTVNGILAPSPLSLMLMETEVVDKPQAGSSEPSPIQRQHSTPKEEHEPKAASSSSSKKKRTTEGNEEFFFKLFKFPKAQGDDEEYLLEMHDPKTCGVDRSHLFVHERNGKWKIGTCDLAAGDHVVVPVVEDHSSPPKFPKKYMLSLQERLTGWTVERRKRTNGREDKFYYHGGRQFRSFVEVAAFMLYSAKLKDLKAITTAQQQPQESNLPSNF